MTTATVTWADGRAETLTIIHETATQFVTDDVNRSRWWKHTGLRVGASRYVKVGHRARAFWAMASAKIN